MPSTKILNIAHRGARSLAPENTLVAAQKGFDSGADMWELDVTISADGKLVIIHDDTCERTSNISQVFPDRRSTKIHELLHSELIKLDFGTWFTTMDPFQQIAAGQVAEEDLKSYRGLQLPTLEQALKFTWDVDKRVNVEIKSLSGTPKDNVVVEKVVELIQKMHLTDRVIISSFNHSYLVRSKKALPGIATAALVDKPDPEPVALLRRLDAQAYNPKADTLDATIVQKLRTAGFDVLVWTVNDEAGMQKFIQAGVSGIITDFPQVLRNLL